MSIDPSRPDQVAPALLGYLRGHRDVTELRFAEAPEPLGRGFDTYTYAFRLEEEGLDSIWARQLVLRIYPTPDQAEKAMREAAVQRFAAQRDFPAPTPLAVERTAAPFGLPIMVLERLPGKTMMERLSNRPFALLRLLTQLADTQVALHLLPTEGCPLPSDGPLVARQLAQLRQQSVPLPTKELETALAWLEAHRDLVIPEEPSLCHGDFHPMNVMVADDGSTGVLDWSDAAVGDRHYDVARTLVLFWVSPIAANNAPERLFLHLIRGFLARRYLSAYRRRLAIDASRLRYWQAFHAFQGWLQVSELHSASAAAVKKGTVERVPTSLASELRRYFWKQTRA